MEILTIWCPGIMANPNIRGSSFSLPSEKIYFILAIFLKMLNEYLQNMKFPGIHEHITWTSITIPDIPIHVPHFTSYIPGTCTWNGICVNSKSPNGFKYSSQPPRITFLSLSVQRNTPTKQQKFRIYKAIFSTIYLQCINTPTVFHWVHHFISKY